MGLGDIVGTVLTRYKVDVSDAKAGLKELTGEQKKQAQEAVKGMEAQNKSIDATITKMGLWAAGIGSAVAIGIAGFKAYEQQVRLSAGATGADLGRLTLATDGLKTRTELLQFATDGMTGRFKLTSKELETVAKGMRAFELAGKDGAKMSEAVGAAMLKGEIDPLKELGITYDETLAKGSKKLAFLDAMTKAGPAAGKALPTDDVRRMGVEFQDSLQAVQISIGKLVVALGPLISETARAITEISTLVARIGDLPDSIAGSIPGGSSIRKYGGKALSVARNFTPHGQFRSVLDYATADRGMRMATGEGSLYMSPEQQAEWEAKQSGWQTDGSMRNDSPRIRAMMEAQQRQRREGAQGVAILAGRIDWLGRGIAKGLGIGEKSKRRTGGRRVEVDEWSLVDRAGVMLDDFTDAAGRYGAEQDVLRAEADAQRSSSAGGSWDENFGYAKRQFGQFDKDMAQMASDRNQSKLEQIFGPVSDFDAYATGFNLLTTAVTAGFDAWMTGAVGVGEAMKMAVAGFAKSLASEALMQAMRHTAYGFGALAIGGPLAGASAGAHFKTAAVWGGVAVAAGIAAKGLGGGAPSAGAGAAGGYRASGGGASSGSGEGRVVNVVIGGGGDESPRANSRRVSRALFLAEQTGFSPRPPGVEFS